MDIRKFSKFIIALGAIAFLSGIIYWGANEPLSQKTKRIDTYFEIQRQNLSRASRQKEATKVIIAGVIVTVVGVGMFAAAKKKD